METTTEKSTPAPKRHWYAIHTYSGHEDKVRRNLEQRRRTQQLRVGAVVGVGHAVEQAGPVARGFLGGPGVALQHRHRGDAQLMKPPGRREPCRPAADDDHVTPLHGSSPGTAPRHGPSN